MELSPTIAAKLAELRAAKERKGVQANGTQEQDGRVAPQAGFGSEVATDSRASGSEQQTEAGQRTEQLAAQLLGGVQTAATQAPASTKQYQSGVALTAADLIINRIGELKEALQQSIPGYERMLQQIHTALAQDEEIVHLLTEEQIGVICAGLAKRKNVVLVAAAAQSKTESKRLSAVSVDEI